MAQNQHQSTEELIENAKKLQKTADAAREAVKERRRIEREARREQENAKAIQRVNTEKMDHEFASEAIGEWVSFDPHYSGAEVTLFDWSTPQSSVNLTTADLIQLRDWLNHQNLG